MSSKQAILAAIRAQKLPAVAAPDLPGSNSPGADSPRSVVLTYGDPLAQFKSVLETIGARCHLVASMADLNDRLAATPELAAARQVVSLVPGAGAPNIDLAAIDDAHQLNHVDLAILPGAFGVAENGAIWVTSRGVRHRAIFIIAERLALVLPRREILQNMHEAYARLAPWGSDRSLGADDGVLGADDWGAFIAGPSKTADIEQSLVIGAHGPRSLDVFCLAG